MVELADPQSFKRALRDAIEETSREEVMEAVEYAEAEANRVLRNVAQNPPPGASLETWHLESIAESSTVRWDDGRQIAVAEWEHPHADKIEVGVKPHLIEGDPVLHWTDPETGEDRFATEVDHPGIPAVGYIRAGFRRALEEFFA